MPLTRAWAIILAFLATACLAGMFLLAGSQGSGFSDPDHAAVRAVTEAGVAAMEAEIQSSPVQQIDSVQQDSRMKEVLATEADPDDPEALEAAIYDTLSEVAEETRVRTGSNLTVALVDKSGALLATSGAAANELPELIASAPFQEAPTDQDVLFSVTLAESLYVVKLLRPDADGRRFVAVTSLDTGAGSLLRRVLGSGNPAAVVRKGEMLGDIIGDQPVQDELLLLAKEHHRDAPGDGASKVFTVGEGMDARLGALGRVPGPAGQGDDGAMLVVLSARTAAAGQQDLAGALAEAKQNSGDLNWPLLGGLLVVTVGLAFYLPGLEGLTPMRRLGREFTAIAQGTQHSIFHDRYSGTAGEVARAAAAAHEALRQAYLAELEIDEEDAVEDSASTASRPRTRTTRGRRLTRSQRSVDSRSRGHRTVRRDDDEASDSEPPAQAPVAQAAPAAPPPAATPAPPMAPAAPPIPAAPAPAAAPPAFAPPAVANAGGGGIPGLDPQREAYFRTVYEEFVRIKTACGEPTDRLAFDKFAHKLAKNTNDIKKKRPDVRDVQFSVYVKDGKAALKAKIVKA